MLSWRLKLGNNLHRKSAISPRMSERGAILRRRYQFSWALNVRCIRADMFVSLSERNMKTLACPPFVVLFSDSIISGRYRTQARFGQDNYSPVWKAFIDSVIGRMEALAGFPYCSKANCGQNRNGTPLVIKPKEKNYIILEAGKNKCRGNSPKYICWGFIQYCLGGTSQSSPPTDWLSGRGRLGGVIVVGNQALEMKSAAAYEE